MVRRDVDARFAEQGPNSADHARHIVVGEHDENLSRRHVHVKLTDVGEPRRGALDGHSLHRQVLRPGRETDLDRVRVLEMIGLTHGQLQPAHLRERARIDQVEPVAFDNAFEDAERRGGKQHVAAVEDTRTAFERDATHLARALIGENGAGDGGGALSRDHRRLQFFPLVARNSGDIERTRELAAQECVAHGFGDVARDVALRFICRRAHVRHQEHVLGGAQRMVRREWFLLIHVEHRAGHVTGLQRVEQRFVVHDPATRHVDHDRATLEH